MLDHRLGISTYGEELRALPVVVVVCEVSHHQGPA